MFKILPFISDDAVFTFNQSRGGGVLNGNLIALHRIDTAMFVVPTRMCKIVRWKPDMYNADGHFITEVLNNNRASWIYANNTLCYYNKQSIAL